MATQSLYRRYRPRRFSEVKGQDHVVRALRNAVAEGREGQAYLFSGPRGTGKTSTARILAKVLNCENPQEGEPCCECASCLAVERGTSYDVHELDAASNNGVDAMRDLIEKASLGTPGRHKVYILDEVHMLSRGAEAALLKTLEEPPPHVVFVLATTDPQKMSDTIRSRTQHLQFHLLPAETLQEHIRWVAADAGLEVSDAAVESVLDQGAGSARDALSALELVANAGDDGIEAVALDEFVEAMIDRDSGRALTMVAHAINLGRDPRTLTEELIRYLRNGFLSLMAPDLVQLPSHRIDALADQSRRLGPPGLVRGIEHLGTALTDMRHAPDPRVLLDVATVQLTADSVAPDLGALVTRLDRLEQRMADGLPAAPTAGEFEPAAAAPVDPATGRAALGGRARTSAPAAPAESPPESAASPSVESPAAPAESPAAPAESPAPSPQTSTPSDDPAAADATAQPVTSSPGPDTAEAITLDVWENTIRPGLRGMARAVYAPATFVRSTATTLTLSVPNAVHRDKCEQHRDAVEQALSAAAGAPVAVELLDGDDGPSGGGGGDGAANSEIEPADAPPSVDPTPTQGPGGSASRVSDTDVLDDGPPAVAPTDEVAPVESSSPPTYAEADDEIDLDDLVDAPPESVKTPIDRLAEAFPGSELIEDVS